MVFLLETALLVWMGARYLRAWEGLHRTTFLPTLPELRLHMEILPSAFHAGVAAGLLLLTFLAFCVQAILARRWWGWLVLFAGQALCIGIAWWAYRIELFRLEQQVAWDDILPGGGGTLEHEGAPMLAPVLVGGGLTVFFLTLAVFCAVRWGAARRERARFTALRASMLSGMACPACGAADTLRRVTEGFAAGKVQQCTACGHTRPIRMEASGMDADPLPDSSV